MRWIAGIAAAIVAIAVLAVTLPVFFADSADTKLAQVKAAGELVIVTRRGPSTYLETVDGASGFEHDLAKAFANALGVRLKVVAVDRYADVLPTLAQGGADMATAGITITDEARDSFLYTPPYYQVRQQVVFRQGTKPPMDARDLIGRQIDVRAGTNHAMRLRELKKLFPKLKWGEVSDLETEDLLQQVWEGLLEITVADSHTIALNRQFFPELQIAFDLSAPQPLVWAFPLSEDRSLYDAAVQFLERYRNAGELAHLVDRYFGPSSHSNFINLRVYHARIYNRLPEFQSLFEFAGQQVELDWRLIAAIAYQESYWDPKALSPTGVRGMMMLTEETAKQVGVTDLFDAEQSILGGARYIRGLVDRLHYIPPSDRVWFALAAYNVGFGHLEDARVITEIHGKDPNSWTQVAKHLPLLEDPRWYNRANYGFARGTEPVIFVNRIRAYYEVLVKLDEEQRMKGKTDALKLKLPAI